MDTNIGIQATTECLKSIVRIGSTVWVNVCTGKETTVPWGAGDWVTGILETLFLAGFVGFVIVGLVKILRD